MNYLEKESLLRQIKTDTHDFTNWLLNRGKQFTFAQHAVNRLYRSAGGFDSQKCSYLGLDGNGEETALYKQFRKEREYKQQLNAIPKPNGTKKSRKARGLSSLQLLS